MTTDNYKLSRELALRVIDLRKTGLSFQKICDVLRSESNISLNESSVRRFYKNFIEGKSNILPKDEVNINVSNPVIIDETKTENERRFLNKFNDAKPKPAFDESIFEASTDDLKDFFN